MPAYRYRVEGTGGKGQAWIVSGTLTVPRGGFSEATQQTLRDAFAKLTRGEATYGEPGHGGCTGPYTIRKLVVEADPD